VILAGNNQPAIDVLDLLLERLPSDALLCIAPGGPPRHGWQASLARAAAQRGIRCLTPDDVNDDATVSVVAAHRADLLLSVYYTQIFRAALLAAIPGPILNYHPSLLPRHRGTAPVVHAIAEGDATTGLSVHHIDAGVDTGRLVWQRSVAIGEDDTAIDLHGKLGRLVSEATTEIMDGWLRDGGLPAAFDQVGEPTLHRSTDPPLNALDLTQPRRRVLDVVRALAPPLPGAYLERDGVRTVLVRARRVDAPLRPPGTVQPRPDGSLVVWAADGALLAEVASY
jgi:methionyl-tRNA formyltransferase